MHRDADDLHHPAADLDRDEALRREGELAPMRRVGQPEEIADVVAFLLIDRSSYMNGAEVTVDGGASPLLPIPAAPAAARLTSRPGA